MGAFLKGEEKNAQLIYLAKKQKHTLSPFLYGLVYHSHHPKLLNQIVMLKKKNTTTLLQNLFIHGIFQNEIIKVLLRGQMQKIQYWDKINSKNVY